MQTANCWLVIDEARNSNVYRKGVTPAEAQILRKMFGNQIAGTSTFTNPLIHLSLAEEIERSSEEEYGRLMQAYGKDKVTKAFPGDMPVLAQTFKEVGFSETEEDSPKEGKVHAEYPPLELLPVGDKSTQ